MTTRKLNKVERIDPTLAFTEIVLLDTPYKLCFRFRELAIANAWLREQGLDLDLLVALPRLDMDMVSPILAAGLHTFHPELTLALVEPLVDYDTVYMIRGKLSEAWLQALPPRMKTEGKNPQEPVQS